MVTHVENFDYADWSITRVVSSSKITVYSSGTATKTSPLYPVNKIVGDVSASVYGGYGWASAYVDSDNNEEGCSLAASLTANIYLVTEGGQRISKASGTGSAYKGGYLNLYANRTSATAVYNINNMTAEEKSIYKYVQIEYTCVTTNRDQDVDRYGAFENGDTKNPVGSATVTIRDSINTFLDGTEMEDLYYDGDQIDMLYFDGNIVF